MASYPANPCTLWFLNVGCHARLWSRLHPGPYLAGTPEALLKAGSILSIILLATAVGCGSGDSGPDGGSAGDASSGGGDAGTGGGDAGAGGDGGDGGAGGDAGMTTPGTPVLLTASLVTHGTMSLEWQNPISTCATVEINRKKDTGAYSVAQTLTGQATSAQDMPGHANGTYCYTITCKLNGIASSPSNEKCVTQ